MVMILPALGTNPAFWTDNFLLYTNMLKFLTEDFYTTVVHAASSRYPFSILVHHSTSI